MEAQTYSDEEVKQLQKICRVAVDDSARLTSLLKRACKHLCGPFQQQADNVVGILVATNATRLLSTVWTVLFQFLRETEDAKVKVMVLRHFACICDRINAEQRINAFRVFAKEALDLLQKIDVIVDNTFIRSFAVILESLGLYAEKDWCQQLCAALIKNIKLWDRSDALRAAVSTAVTLVAWTTWCGTLEEFLLKAKQEFSVFSFVLTLDSCVPVMAKRTGVKGGAVKSLQFVENLCGDSMAELLLSDTGVADTHVLPSVITCYLKIKEVDPDWNITGETAICGKVLSLLGSATVKRILVTPFLRYLQKTNVSWWKRRKTVVNLATNSDSLTRGEAFTALANAAKRTSCAELARALPLAAKLFTRFFEEGCISTVVGIIHYVEVALVRVEDDELREQTLNFIFTSLSSTISTVSENALTQIAALRMLASQSNVRVEFISYAKRRMLSEDPVVQSTALKNLLHWSTRVSFDDLYFNQPSLRAVDFYEWSCVSVEEPYLPLIHESMTALLSNFRVIFEFLLNDMMEHLDVNEGARSSRALAACKNMETFITFASPQISVEGGQIFAPFLSSLNGFLGDCLATAPTTTAVYLQIFSLFTVSLRECSAYADGFCIFDHKDTVNLVYNILVECCKYIDRGSVKNLREEECVYFSKQKLPDSVVKMIHTSAQTSLTNKQAILQTEFYVFTSGCMRFLSALVSAGAESPVFCGHLSNMYAELAVVLSVLGGMCFDSSLELLHLLHRTLFPAGIRNSVTKTSPDYAAFASATSAVVAHGIQCDFCRFGEKLFATATLTVEWDTQLCTRTHYLSLDPRGSIASRAASLMTWEPAFIKSVPAVESALRFLLALFRSPHRALAEKYFDQSVLQKSRNAWRQLELIAGESQAAKHEELLDELEHCLLLDEGEADRSSSVLDKIANHGFTDGESFFELLEKLSSCMPTNENDRKKMALDKTTKYASNKYVLVSLSAIECTVVPLAIAVTAEDSSSTETYVVDLMVAVMAHVPPDVVLPRILVSLKTWNLATERLLSCYHWGYDVENSSPHALFRQFKAKDAKVDEKDTFQSAVSDIIEGDKDGMTTCSSSSGEDDVSLALRQLPFGVCAFSLSPSQLMTDCAMNAVTVADIFECAGTDAALQLTSILIEEGKFELLTPRAVIALARCLLMRDPVSETFDKGKCLHLVRRFSVLLDESVQRSTFFCESMQVLRCSILLVLLHVFPSGLGECLTEPAGDTSSQVFELLRKCSGMQSGAISAEKFVAFITSKVIVIETKSSCENIEHSILWLVVRLCGQYFWKAFLSNDDSAHGFLPDQEMSDELRFLCVASQTIGFPPEMWGKIHEKYTPMLLDFGENPDITSDEQRYVLWVVTSIMLCTTWPGDRYAKPVIHTSFVDNVYEYSDFPLQPLEAATSWAARQLSVQTILPFYKRRVCRLDDARHCNLHVFSLRLPFGSHSSHKYSVQEATAAGKVGVSMLHMLGHTLEEVASRSSTLAPWCLNDVLAAVSILTIENPNLLRFAPMSAPESMSSKAVRLSQQWLHQFAEEWLENDRGSATERSVLRDHIGLFPGSLSSLLFNDIATITATSIVLSCFSPSLDSSPTTTTATDAAASRFTPSKPVNITALLSRMLSTDLFLYTAGTSSIVAFCSASRRREVSELAGVIARRIGDDLRTGRWGMLSVPFVLLQLLRCSCAVLTTMPEERVATKVCEGVWDGILQRPWGRVLTFYAHYILQCLLQITTVGGRQRRQWEMLRMLLMSGRSSTWCFASEREQVLPLWSIGFYLSTQQQKNRLPPHQSFPRRVSLSWSEAATHKSMDSEFTPLVHYLKERYLDLQDLVTRTTLILRSTHGSNGISANADELDRSGVQAADLLSSFQGSHSGGKGGGGLFLKTSSCVELLCLEVVTDGTLCARDTFFAAINRFDFSIPARRTILHELTHVLSDAAPGKAPLLPKGSVGKKELDLLSLFFEAASRRVQTEENGWWLSAVVLSSLLGAMSDDVSRALLAAVVMPQPAALVQRLSLALAHFFRGTPLLATATQLFSDLCSQAEASPRPDSSAWLGATSVLHALKQNP